MADPETPKNSKQNSLLSEQEGKTKQEDPKPGEGVDPVVLTEKLSVLAGERGPQEVEDEEAKTETQGEEEVLLEESYDEEPAEEKTEEVLVALSHVSDISENEHLYVTLPHLHGNIKLMLTENQIVYRPEIRPKQTFETEILRNTRCPLEGGEKRSLRLKIESVWWESCVPCGVCPARWACTCGLSVGEIVRTLTYSFELIAIIDQGCRICSLMQYHYKKRHVLNVCQLSLDDIDAKTKCELRTFLRAHENDDFRHKIVDHWRHEEKGEICDYQSLEKFEKSLKKDDYYDIIVIGSGSAAYGICEEAAKLQISICLVEIPPDKHTNNDMVELAIKGFLMEATKIKNALNHGKYVGISETENVVFDWVGFQENLEKHIEASIWKHQKSFSRTEITRVTANVILLDRNTLKLVYPDGRKESAVFHYLVLAAEGGRYYPTFPGSGWCKRLDRIHKSPGTTGSVPDLEGARLLIVGETVQAFQFASMTAELGAHVTLLVKDKIPQAYDEDIMERILVEMKERDIEIMLNCQIRCLAKVPRSVFGRASIPYVDEDFVVLVMYLQDGEEDVRYADYIILLPHEGDSLKGISGLEDIGVKFCKHNPNLIEVNKNFATSIINIFAIGSFVSGLQNTQKDYENLGRNFVRATFLGEPALHPDQKLHFLSTVPEYAFYGPSEQQAKEAYGDDVVVYHTLHTQLATVSSPFDLRKPAYAKLVCRKREYPQKHRREDVISLHVVGDNAFQVVQGLSYIISEGITKEEMSKIMGEDYSFAKTVLDMDMKKEDRLPSLLKVNCCMDE